MANQENKGPFRLSFIGTAVTIASYFIIKYGIVARFVQREDFTLVYSILLIFTCVFIGRAVERMLEERKKEE
ncbi:MAG: hypothetical protein AAF828_05625 [Bacteroidota bacterium]